MPITPAKCHVQAFLIRGQVILRKTPEGPVGLEVAAIVCGDTPLQALGEFHTTIAESLNAARTVAGKPRPLGMAKVTAKDILVTLSRRCPQAEEEAAELAREAWDRARVDSRPKPQTKCPNGTVAWLECPWCCTRSPHPPRRG